MNKRVGIIIVGTIIALLIVILGIVVIVKKVVQGAAPNQEQISPAEFFQVPEGELMMFQNDHRSEQNTIIRNDQAYLPLALVQSLNKSYYWDEEENALIYTTGTELMLVPVNESYYYVNDKKIPTQGNVLIQYQDTLYVLLSYVEDHVNLKYQIYNNPNRIMLQYRWGEYLYADVVTETQLRTDFDKKSPILLELPIGTRLHFVDSGGIQQNGYVMAMTTDGICGYVRAKDISESYYLSLENDYTDAVYSTEQRENSVNLTWHMIVSEQANAQLEELYAGTEGLNVISPTWFNIRNEQGMLESRADASYVSRAHELGLEVWGLVSNFHPDSAKTVEIDELELLQSYSHRCNLIQQIILYAMEFDLDGINIDFESLSMEVGPFYIQFLRELAVACRNRDLVLSVDNYVPAEYNAFYDLETQGKIVDYVIIMGYDEHYVGSEAGSVASLGFIAEAAKNTLAMVPAERIIMAIPFYTRLWKETKAKDGTIAVTSGTIGIADAERYLRENKVSTTWQSDIGQFYGEHEQGEVRYRIWLEDELSIEEKMKVIQSSGFAGVASWRLGLEKRSIWEVMMKYLH